MLFIFKKRGFLASFLLTTLLSLDLYASRFVYSPQGLLLEKTIDEMDAISQEVYEKTNVGVFSAVLSELPQGETLEGFQEKLISDLPESYILITLVSGIKKIDIKTSEDLKKIDTKRIYWDYMVPLLPNNERELTTKRISAVIFNGYMDAAGQVASLKDVRIEGLPPAESETVGNIIQYIFYFFAGSLILILVFSYIRGGKNS